ncbi:hypothetical protein [Spirosoma flavum]|uniref:Lipoprotein n=1 Tax=Spirosoma flavum TaxID=2048557 RepID=A0ABW6AEF4_9BACT
MAILTTPTISSASIYYAWLIQTAKLILFAFFIANLIACNKSSQPGSGTQKKLRVAVGEIKEVSLSNRGNGMSELIGSSDNQEVVEVSRQQLAQAVDTLKRNNTGPTVFQIKGITIGTANVVFSTKPLNQAGSGKTVQTYVVQVTAK